MLYKKEIMYLNTTFTTTTILKLQYLLSQEFFFFSSSSMRHLTLKFSQIFYRTFNIFSKKKLILKIASS